MENLKKISSKPLVKDTLHFPKWLMKDINCIENINGKSYLIIKGNK